MFFLTVVDGEDLSSYDTVGDLETRNMEDQESLSKLEWELASESGRVTGKESEHVRGRS